MNRRKWFKNVRPLGLEMLEERVNPDVTFGWEAGVGGTYFRIDGDASSNTTVLTTLANGDTQFSVSYVEDGETFTTGGTISAGEIALAQLAFGPFQGFHVLPDGGSDTTNASALSGHKIWVEDDLTGAAGNDTIMGGGRQDKLSGGAGNDTITGGAGVDIITGGDGNDNLNGGSGSDTVDGGQGSDIITVSDTVGTDILVGGTGGETFDTKAGAVSGNRGDELILNVARAPVNNADFEFVQGSGGNDVVDSSTYTPPAAPNPWAVGGAANGGRGGVIVNGGAGNDTLTGSATSDTLNGDAGNDIIEGRGGLADILNGGADIDTLSYVNSPAAVTVDLTLNTATGGDATGDSISNFENLTGSAFDDTLTGNSGANTINGGEGNDTISAGGGIDVVNGGGGNDEIDGGSGNDDLRGDAGDDVLVGGLGNDTLDGGVGLDLLDGGVGNDLLRINFDNIDAVANGDQWFGGAGLDTFRFYGVTHDANGNAVESEVQAAFDALDLIFDLGQSDWDETSDMPIDFVP